MWELGVDFGVSLGVGVPFVVGVGISVGNDIAGLIIYRSNYYNLIILF